MMAVAHMLKKTCFVESRKRPLKEPVELFDIKRERSNMEDCPHENGVNFLSPPHGQFLLKVLIPGYAAGAVIGKGGQIVENLQKDSGSIIKLSKAKDFYPGTQDRVVLIQGNAEGVMKVHTTIVEKVHEFPISKEFATIVGDRPKQVKIIVPNTTAGLVIGKAGATIKSIMEESGSKIQLSQKPDGVNVQERVITIKGDIHQLIASSNLIIDKIKGDPQSASCPNISYSEISGPVASANPTGSPYARGYSTILEASHPAVQAMLGHYVIPGHHSVLPLTAPISHYLPHHSTAVSTISSAKELLSLSTDVNKLANYSLDVKGNTLRVIPGLQANVQSGLATSLNLLQAGAIPGVVSPAPHTSPFISASAPPLENVSGINAMTDAALPTGMQSPPKLSLHNNCVASFVTAEYLIASCNANLNSPGVAGGLTNVAQPTLSMTLPNVPVLTNQSTAIASSTVSPPPPVSLLNIEKSSDGQKDVIDLSIPENLIGAILGKAGRTLVEFQEISGAKIQISKKGQYVAGTRNRKVTITGKPTSSQTAHVLITQRIAAVQAARAQQAKPL